MKSRGRSGSPSHNGSRRKRPAVRRLPSSSYQTEETIPTDSTGALRYGYLVPISDLV